MLYEVGIYDEEGAELISASIREKPKREILRAPHTNAEERTTLCHNNNASDVCVCVLLKAHIFEIHVM